MTNTIELSSSSESVEYLCKKDKRLAKVISMVGDIQYQPHTNGDEYPFIIHEIIEQMLSIKAGKKIYDRLVALCSGEITPEHILALSTEDIRSTGTSKAKAEYIQIISKAVTSGDLVFSELEKMTDDAVIKKLTSYRGLGNWTAKMYLIFVLDRKDILPYEDGAFLQSYRWMYKPKDCSTTSICKKCAKWKPYSSIAARYLYRALDMGLTKNEFHLFK